MNRRVVVIGGGVAGLSAAYTARERGARVTIVSAGVGTSALGGGVVDDLPWETWFVAARTLGEPPKLRPLPDDVLAFCSALGVWDVPRDGHAPVVATAAGRLRPARGRDRGLLDLGALRQTTVLVPRLARANWDADALGATLESEALAREAELRFVAVDAPVLRFTDETRISDADVALRHDEPARLAWLAKRLTTLVADMRRTTSVGAVLLGSWLGGQRERASELAARVGVPVGEVLVGVGSSAGLRYEAAVESFVQKQSLEVVMDRVTAIRRSGERFDVELSGKTVLTAEVIVLAVGGVASGGIVYTPPDLEAGEDVPERINAAYSFGVPTVGLDVPLVVDGARVDAGSSVFGPPLDTTAWPSDRRASTLESVGIEARDGLVCPGVYAAGDVLAGKRRTMLEAIASGLRVGRIV